MFKRLNSGRRISPSKESWMDWVLFKIEDPGEVDEGEFKRELIDESGFGYFYNGPGRSFGHEPFFKINRNYAVIKQHCGMDI